MRFASLATMPIKPENRARYPADWPAIRAIIRERAGDCCEKCKAPDRTLIARGTGSDAGTYMLMDGEVRSAETGEKLGYARGSEYSTARMIEVVLTVGHLDHQPENCAPDNLRLWCQRCHLNYDAGHHAVNARATRMARKAIGDLFAD